jgi:fibrillarin-like pre-rRNA processing protein
MSVEQIFDGVYRIDGKIATRNMVKGKKVYDEELVTDSGIEYRLWNPYRSKLAAAIAKGLKRLTIKKGSRVLYLGAATGTTSSHVSDIVGKEGEVFCIEIAERSMRELLKLCEQRPNILPMLQDARNAEAYSAEVGTVDAIYQDVSAKDQDEILLRNSVMLKKRGLAYVAIKSQSIDVSRRPREVFDEFLKNVSVRFNVIEEISITPFDQMHLFVVLEKKSE